MATEFLDSFGVRKPAMKTLEQRIVDVEQGLDDPLTAWDRSIARMTPAEREKFAAMEREHANIAERICCVCGGVEIDGRCNRCVRHKCDA